MERYYSPDDVLRACRLFRLTLIGELYHGRLLIQTHPRKQNVQRSADSPVVLLGQKERHGHQPAGE